MSNENPTENSRDVFDENEAGIAQKKQEMTDAVAAGDYAKVAELAQEAEGMKVANKEIYEKDVDEALETNKGIDEAKALEEKAAREAALAEQVKLDAEKSQKEAAELLEKMKGSNAESEQENVSLSDEALKVEDSLMRLFSVSDQRDFDQDPELNLTRIALRGLDARTQEKLSQDFFDRTIGQDIKYIPKAYEVYRRFKGITFGNKFAELEDARLKASGYKEGLGNF